jgi:hypothetical protein
MLNTPTNKHGLGVSVADSAVKTGPKLGFFFFFPQFCDVAQVVITHKMIYPDFGYILDMKVENKIRILLYSWLLIGIYHKNLMIWILFCFKISQIWVNFFSMKNPFYRLKSYFSGQNLLKFHPPSPPPHPPK